jgi:hypothetical protein
MMKDKWTKREEEELQRLMKRRNELRTMHLAPLLALIVREDFEHCSHEDIASAMVALADEFRDALEPFDSGERPLTPAPEVA